MAFDAALNTLRCHQFRQPQFMGEKGVFPVSEFRAACLAAEAAAELLTLAQTPEQWNFSSNEMKESFLFAKEIFNLTRGLDERDVCRFHAIRDIAQRHLTQP